MRFAVFVLVLSSAAFGQVGSIEGKVLDPTGSPHAGAAVQAKANEGGAVFKGVSSGDGKYSIANLPAGAYDVTVNIGGLRGYDKKDVMVQGGKAASLDIHLEEGTQLSTLGEDPQAIAAKAKLHVPTAGATPRTVDGNPDLSGVWWGSTTTDPGRPEFLPAAQQVAKARADMNGRESPQAHCLPSAITRTSYPLFAVVQSREMMVIVQDDDSPGFRQIYLNEKDHPADPNPSWWGHSIGHWDGDTLVVDRIAFDPRAWLDQGGHPHSDKLHVVERYRRPDMGHLEIDLTVEDPGVLTKPYTIKRVSELAGGEINEFICTENNRDVEHLVGK